MSTVAIPARFNGPDGSANGGYACGAIAEAVGGLVEVTLRAPPPLDRPMTVATSDDQAWTVTDGDTLVAEARRCDPWSLDVPDLPTLGDATEASGRYLGASDHEFPRCVVCGPDRLDGLRIFPGALTRGVVAAPWRPAEDLPGNDTVTTEIMWAALDCPGAWSSARDIATDPIVLGRMRARIDRPARRGEDHVVVGWSLGDEGRKSLAGTAVATAEGELLAVASQTWIAITP